MFRNSAKLLIEDPSAPSTAYAAYVQMEDLLEKLKILNYDNEIVEDLKMKKYISRHYFMIPTNPGEQFHTFSSLAAWLVRKAGKNFDPPQESDDPNATIAKILDCLKEIGITTDIPQNKLKQGVGEHAVFVLDNLADQAIKAFKFKWKKVQIPSDEGIMEPEVEEDEAEIILEKVEEEMLADFDDEDDDIVHVDDITKLYKEASSISKKPEKILESTVDAEEWKLELERVLPQLKLSVNADNRDWRSHLQEMKKLHSIMSKSLPATTSQLDKLHIDIGRALEKIKTRETYLNQQLEPQLQELRMLQEELSRIKERYRNASGDLTERKIAYDNLCNDYNQLKKEMDERGSSMTDGTPLINIKKNIGKMKSEISEMSIRIGVLEYSLMCSRVRDRAQLQEEMNNTTSTVSI
ncbi:intraflagellar transport protein 57 homolog [Phymastichus coffea]|uniref:intraflagellar transport protein 57 homolog n=1 Tax=Phymastichus coffea TaxID=108790 RepID=UPI00273B08E3|nr:intraflagellar transport protein 57 homolog [Phymastichus coffea]